MINYDKLSDFENDPINHINWHDVYEYHGGFLYRKTTYKHHKKGSKAGHLNPHTGYHMVSYKGVKYPIHRVIWAMFNGDVPKDKEIDHKNGDRGDSRIVNLRLATRNQNQANRKTPSTNKTGYKGVTTIKSGKAENIRYRAMIIHHGIKYSLGCYDTPEQAKEAYDKKAVELNGEYARKPQKSHSNNLFENDGE